jgi:hypothetical protein
MITEIKYRKNQGIIMEGLVIPEPVKHLYDVDPLNLAIDKIKDLP